MSDYRYTLRDRLGELIVSPLGESDFSITWSRDDDEGKLSYKRSFGGTITFIGDAYKRLVSLEGTVYRCEYQDIVIQRNCGKWKDWFKGRISLNSGIWDLDGCKVTLKFESDSPTKCFEDNKGNEIDLFDISPFRKQVKMFPGDAIIETKNCIKVRGTSSGLEYYWCGDSGIDPFDFGWTVYYHEQAEADGNTETTTKWARQKTTIPCDQEISPDWILLSDDCVINGTRTYVRPVNLKNCIRKNNYDISGSWDYYYLLECEVFGLSDDILFFKNGMLVNHLLEEMVGKFCEGLKVKSNFLGIGVEPDPINYVTGSKSKVLDLMLFQKSDIKRPNSASVATRAKWTFEKLINMLVKTFNLRWDIIENEFVIEHVSYFNKNIGLNLNESKYSKFVKGKRQYSYKQEDMPSSETWMWMEATANTDFKGQPIVYDNGCVTNSSKEIKEEYIIDDVTSDIELVISNPDSDSSVVEDTGFVLIATQKETNGEYYIITEAGILDEPRINNSLGISQILRDYHTYNRPYKEGFLNGQEVEFDSVKPTKLGATLTIPFCCGDEFNPKDYVNTFFGRGTVDKAIFNFKTSTIALDLLYDAYSRLQENTPPNVENQVIRIFQDEVKIIDITEGWSDEDRNASILSAEIKRSPSHGTAFLRPDLTVRYKPDRGYIGNDNFTFSIKDNWGEESNIGLISIQVLEANTAPEANDDYYSTRQDKVLNVFAPGVFRNDTSVYGFSLQGYDNTSQNGGSVNIQANGTLRFTPNPNFVGIDEFNYTIVDQWGNTSTATVYITVTDPNSVVAVDDYYTTAKNISFAGVAGGSKFGGLLDNDYTPSGNIPLSAESGTFQTQNGGEVVIQSTGDFIYMPPENYLGVDSFDYTVNNANGSDTATAYINVIEKIFVRMVSTNLKSNNIVENCSGVQTNVGRTRTKDIDLKFFKDAAGTIPYNNVEIPIFVELQERSGSQNWNAQSQKINISIENGIANLATDFEYRYEYRGCENEVDIFIERRYVFKNGPHYQMI